MKSMKKIAGATKYKRGGLKKANNGTIVKEGPITQKDAEMLNTSPVYKDTNKAYGYFSSGMQPTPKGYRVTPQTMKDDKEKEIRSGSNFKKGGMTKTKYMTGGMVNANAKVSALKQAGSKGVKSGVNPKASASKVAKGRSGGTSKAPKDATPKKNKKG
jgi:hypothetical protein